MHEIGQKGVHQRILGTQWHTMQHSKCVSSMPATSSAKGKATKREGVPSGLARWDCADI